MDIMIFQQLNGLNKNFCVITTMNISVVNNMHLNAKVWFTLIHKANIHSAESKLVPTRNIKGRSPIKKTGKCGNFSQVGNPPSPLFGNDMFFFKKKYFFFLHFRTFFWGVSHVKNSKKWKGDSGRPPPPLFFQNSHIFPFFLATSIDPMIFVFPYM